MKVEVRPYHHAYGQAWQVEVFDLKGDLVYARRGITEREADSIAAALRRSWK